jgi:hypothetical protein
MANEGNTKRTKTAIGYSTEAHTFYITNDNSATGEAPGTSYTEPQKSVFGALYSLYNHC